MNFKAWHWKDLDGGGRRETGREDGGGWFEKVFLHLSITGKVLILKAKVNWSFHLLSLASPLRLRTRRASQKRRRGFCLKRFWYHQLSSHVDMVWISSTHMESMEMVSRVRRLLSLNLLFSKPMTTLSSGVWRLLRGPCPQVSWTRCLSFKGSFPTFSSRFLHNWYLQSINDSTDTCRASMIQPILAEHL